MKKSKDFQMFAAVSHPVEGQRHEILLTLRMKKYLIFLVGVGKTTVSITLQQPILFFKMLITTTANFVLENWLLFCYGYCCS
jgi:hypothetical protein